MTQVHLQQCRNLLSEVLLLHWVTCPYEEPKCSPSSVGEDHTAGILILWLVRVQNISHFGNQCPNLLQSVQTTMTPKFHFNINIEIMKFECIPILS